MRMDPLGASKNFHLGHRLVVVADAAVVFRPIPREASKKLGGKFEGKRLKPIHRAAPLTFVSDRVSSSLDMFPIRRFLRKGRAQRTVG